MHTLKLEMLHERKRLRKKFNHTFQPHIQIKKKKNKTRQIFDEHMDTSNERNGNDAVLPKKTDLKRTDGYYELPETPEIILCPECRSGEVQMNRTIYKLPDGEDILILLLECPNCHSMQRDVIPLKNAFKPGIYELKIDDGDFTHKIMRGASGKLTIPEFDIESERGPSARFLLTNVERILLQMKEAAQILLNSEVPEDRTAAQKAINELTLALEGKLKFTIILEDLKGGSYIVPSNPEKLTFIKKELVESD